MKSLINALLYVFATGIVNQAADSLIHEKSVKVPLSTKVSGEVLANVAKDPKTGTLREMRLKGRVPATLTPFEAATEFLSANRTNLGLQSFQALPEPVEQIKTLTGRQIRYQVFYGGLPVWGSEIKVKVTGDDTVTLVQNKAANINDTTSLTRPPLTEETKATAQSNLVARLKAFNGIVAQPDSFKIEEGVSIDEMGQAKLTWRVRATVKEPLGVWEAMMDPLTGSILGEPKNLAQFSSTARLFFPNPIHTTGDILINPDDPTHDVAIHAARMDVQLAEVRNLEALKGTFVRILTDRKLPLPSGKTIDFARNTPEFRILMAYHWTTEGIRYLHSLGYKDFPKTGPVKIYPDYSTNDASFYNPDLKSIHFGTGGVPDLEDGEVILHELGHAILDGYVENFAPNPNTEARAIAEGFSDYWSASFFEVYCKDPKWNVYFAKWDSVQRRRLEEGSPPYLRRLDSSKKLPVPYAGEDHENGQIWSSALWRIHQALGRDTAAKLILEAHFHLPSRFATFDMAAEEIITLLPTFNIGQYSKAINGIFQNAGILPADE